MVSPEVVGTAQANGLGPSSTPPFPGDGPADSVWATDSEGAEQWILIDDISAPAESDLPEAPTEGTFTLKAVDGVLTWVEDII